MDDDGNTGGLLAMHDMDRRILQKWYWYCYGCQTVSPTISQSHTDCPRSGRRVSHAAMLTCCRVVQQDGPPNSKQIPLDRTHVPVLPT